MSIFYSLVTSSLRAYFCLFHRLRIYGTYPTPKGKAVIAPNHVSFFDPPLMGACWPEEIHFLARASLFHFSFFKYTLPRLNAHPVQGTAQDIQSFRTICQLLNEGKKVVLFPEGIRSPDGELQEFKTGVAMLALRTQSPIIPVYITGTFQAWPRQKRWPKIGPRIACVFGKPIFFEHTDSVNKKQAQENATLQVQKSIESLRLWFEAGAAGNPP
jgi:1-acyl-sn-glycerol-3-phosphate acyltransferase